MSGSRGRRGGRGGGRGGRSGGNGAPVNPVEFNLVASQHFDLSDPPSAVVVKASTLPGTRRLSIQHREALGDVLYWFAATAVAEPSARLVLWQGTRDDKTWLQAFVKDHLPQIQIADEILPNGNKYLCFQLNPAAAAAGAKAAGITPVEPVSAPVAAAAAAAEQPGAAGSSVKEAVAHAAQQAAQAAVEAGHRTGEAAAAAAQAAGQKVAHASEHAKDAAAAVAHKAQEAGKAASGKVAAAVQGVAKGKAEDSTSNQAAVRGESGPSTQLLAIGGAAAGAVAVLGIVLATVLGGKRKR